MDLKDLKIRLADIIIAIENNSGLGEEAYKELKFLCKEKEKVLALISLAEKNG